MKRGRIRYSRVRSRIPGVRDDAGAAVQARDVDAVAAARARALARGGHRDLATAATDVELRAAGVPVFGRSAADAELGGYLSGR